MMRILAAALALLMLVSCSDAVEGHMPPEEIKPSAENSADTAAETSEEDTPDSPAESDESAEPDEDGLTPIYNTSAIVEAYASGDASGLSEKDKEIYDAAVKAVSEFYREGMSGEETVIAAHDWIVTNATYDEKMLLPIPKQSEDAENPYGLLINGQSVCMGYTTTFKMFMDMLGVECIIVRGSSEGEEHAWNQVKLGDNWYHVDVTWDDFVEDEPNRPPFHIYTLLNDSEMELMHVWDHSTSMPADSTDMIYYKNHGLYAKNSAEVKELLNSAYDAGKRHAEIMTDDANTLNFSHVDSYWINDLGDHYVTVYWLR